MKVFLQGFLYKVSVKGLSKRVPVRASIYNKCCYNRRRVPEQPTTAEASIEEDVLLLFEGGVQFRRIL